MLPGQVLAPASAGAQVRDELIARIAHDMRTPIGAILTWLEVLKAQATDPQARRAIEMAQQSARDLSEIVAGAEDAQRIVAGTLDLQRAPLDLVSLLNAVADRVRPAADSRGIVLHCDLAPSVTLARGDDRRLRHVFTRVLAHCVSLSGPGTVGLVLRADEEEARVCVVCPVLTLSTALQRALVAEGEWPAIAGSGGPAVLDFAVACRVINLHGGRLETEPLDGQGTRLCASLPLA